MARTIPFQFALRLIALPWAVASVIAPAWGQTQTAEPFDRIRVEVTGSRIPRTDMETALPVQVITREEIAHGGILSAQDLLERISANQSWGAWNEALGMNGYGPGLIAASLRGLGFHRTLVLLNGQRLAPYALSANALSGLAVDLSAIPISAIDRVEVLKDGASAVYGTDAIGGVINFILRKDYTGAEVNGTHLATEHGGGESDRATVSAGWGDLTRDRVNVFGTLDWVKNHVLRTAERDFSKTAYLPGLGFDGTSRVSFPANIYQPGHFSSLRNPTIAPTGATAQSCLPPYSFPTQSFPRQCRFDASSLIDLLPASEKVTAFGRLTWQWDPLHRFFAEGSYYHGEITNRIAPTPVDDLRATNSPMTLPPNSPYYPTALVTAVGGDAGQPIHVLYRLVEMGLRVNVEKVDAARGIAGIEGSLRDWDYQLALLYTRERTIDNLASGFFLESKFGPLLRSGMINPFGYNSAEVLDRIRETGVTGTARDGLATDYGASFKVAGNVLRLPAGRVALAFGAEWRREDLGFSNAPFTESADILSYGGPYPSLPTLHRTVWALFAEANVPLWRTLEANVAVRHDQYSDFGSSDNPKITLRWQPAKTFLLRGSWGTGFRAPTLFDLFEPNVLGYAADSHDDPARCPVTRSERDCDAIFRALYGGNRSLQPEKSHQWNAGVVVEPVERLSLAADYFSVRIRNAIDYVFPYQIVGAMYPVFGTSNIVRNPPDPAFPNLPGEIAYVISTQMNFGEVRTAGVDLDLRFRTGNTPLGEIGLTLTGTYVTEYERMTLQSDLYPAGAGLRTLFGTGAIARWRHYATVNWSRGPWGATLAHNFQSGYDEPCLANDPSGCTTRRVGSYSVWDAQARYRALRNLTVTVGVRNLFDTKPPLSNQSGAFQVGFDPSLADPRGRMYYATLGYVFD